MEHGFISNLYIETYCFLPFYIVAFSILTSLILWISIIHYFYDIAQPL